MSNLPNPEELLSSIEYDSVSALVLLAIAVGSADGKLRAEELGRTAEVVGRFLGGALSADELWPLVSAAYQVATTEGPNGAIEKASKHFMGGAFGDAAVALSAAVGAATSGIGQQEGLLIRAVAQKCGVQVDSQHYFGLLSAGQALGKS